MKVITKTKSVRFENDDIKVSSIEVTDCELIKFGPIHWYEAKQLINHDLSIVWDEEENQCYVVDNKTRLILSTHLSFFQCFEWLDRTGYELITLKRKYDKKRYQEDVEMWEKINEHYRSNV
nr:MAG TPA: hypothetical protein [Caudoviricetes sp.]